MTPAEMIGAYIACRDWLEADDATHAERQAPVKERMQILEGAVTEALLAAGGESLKTEAGTAYRSTVLAVRCASREDFMDFVFDGRREGFLTSAVAKDAVKEYMQMHEGQIPPGIDVTYIHKTNFRRA